ncbi:MAG TPA: hypothetical protein ENH29_09880 [Bacteroidetes bacterium]|nr:hypothetical protein [Bacteroidota bacterium]
MIMKIHKLRLNQPADKKKIAELNKMLSATDPAAGAEPGDEQQSVIVRYNLRRQIFKQVLEQITSAGLVVERSFWQRLKLAKWGFTEENERDNITARSLPCCSNPEEILSKVKRTN